jgi:hypothetical protein
MAAPDSIVSRDTTEDAAGVIMAAGMAAVGDVKRGGLMPSLFFVSIDQLSEICREARCRLKSMPSIIWS